jgi:hypothetical protein
MNEMLYCRLCNLLAEQWVDPAITSALEVGYSQADIDRAVQGVLRDGTYKLSTPVSSPHSAHFVCFFYFRNLNFRCAFVSVEMMSQ